MLYMSVGSSFLRIPEYFDTANCFPDRSMNFLFVYWNKHKDVVKDTKWKPLMEKGLKRMLELLTQ